ncbi:GGDEF domain-containing protein [Cellulomonas bogoriensis]|uniref:GGDEF domain-containing protein n=1 Tax=Cellulomonas bogoriensis 69B4 = DSM 16987 TaxID=1386082 RepID=A0A0A0BXI6_9CELL|nr:GGDEF domain-containing protein [Cellulomonas bogoriensis]KGM13113.1 hypothetical protein N869_16190 [Cellulomonas bogoriensis 69B4 = DSM 16987]
MSNSAPRDPAHPRPPDRGRPLLSAQATHLGFVALAGTLLVALLSTEGQARDWVVTASGVPPAIAVALALHRRYVQDRRPWQTLLSGLVVLNVYNVWWMVEHYAPTPPPNPGLVVTVGLPIGYLLLLAGTIMLIRRPLRQDAGAAVDAAILGLSIAFLLWVAILEPQMGRDVPLADRMRTMLILVAISAIAGALGRAAVVLPTRRPTLIYMITTVVAILGGTVVRELTTTTTQPGGVWWVGAFWIVAFTAGTAAALHPSAELPIIRYPRARVLSPRRLLALSLALALSPLLLAADLVTDMGTDLRLVVAANLGIVGLVVLRLSQMADRQMYAEDRLAYLAQHDDLTGLANRSTAQERVHRCLGRVAYGVTPGAVITYLDLDGLARINVEHGHEAGDALLLKVTERICDTVRDGDVVGRVGSDEFVLIQEGEPDAVTDGPLRAVLDALDAPFDLDGTPVSIGVAHGSMQVHRGRHLTAETVLREAEAFLIADKHRRRAAARDRELEG